MQRSPIYFNWQTSHVVCLFCGLLGAITLASSPLLAQHKANRLEPRFVSRGEADPAEGREIMTTFRRLGLPGDYFLEFDLEVLPRRGVKSVVKGRMWGSRNERGPISRVDLDDSPETPRTHLIAQNGTNPEAWRYLETTDGEVEALSKSDMMGDLAGTGLRIFELQMPFIHWPDYVFEGVTRIRGRTVHAFLMYPPDEFAEANPEIAAVRLHLDVKFHALMQAVVLGEDEAPLRKLTVLDLKKLGDQWIVKSIDVRDEITRDKVKFEVTGAALDLDYSPLLFAPESLPNTVASPVAVTRF